MSVQFSLPYQNCFLQIVLFIIADMVSSYWLALTFQASHVVSEVDGVDF